MSHTFHHYENELNKVMQLAYCTLVQEFKSKTQLVEDVNSTKRIATVLKKNITEGTVLPMSTNAGLVWGTP